MLSRTDYTSFMNYRKYISKIIKTYFDILKFQCSNEITSYHLNLITLKISINK